MSAANPGLLLRQSELEQLDLQRSRLEELLRHYALILELQRDIHSLVSDVGERLVELKRLSGSEEESCQFSRERSER